MIGADDLRPDPDDMFSFGLWTLGNPGRDPFGLPTRPEVRAVDVVKMIAEAGGNGVNFHDNDLVPIDATLAQRDEIVREFKKALNDHGLVCPMATTNLFGEPVFKDGAFTSNNAKIRAYAVQKTMKAMELGAECGAKIYVFWGGREGVESDATKHPVVAIKRFREAIDFLCDYSISQGYNYKFAFEAKPNEPRGHMYFAVTGSYLALIPSLKHPNMCGVNPELAHEHMAGLNFIHQVAAALEMNKLFHIDLNDQEFGRYDQDFRFGSASPKPTFFLVKLLEDHGYKGPKHFDAHPYRQSDREDAVEFGKGCIRNYLILREKAKRWNADREIQALRQEIAVSDTYLEGLMAEYSSGNAIKLMKHPFDRHALAKARLPYERLDQLTMEIIYGVR